MISWNIILYIAVCLSFFVQVDAQKSRSDLTSLINLLSQKYSGNKQPLIIILDSGTKSQGLVKYLAGSAETSDDEGVGHVPHLLLHQKVKNLVKKSTTKSYAQYKKEAQQIHRLQRLRDNQELQSNDKRALRSPIVKKLLRISNTLQCRAKDDCQDRCGSKYKGKGVIKCNIQCEFKYTCEEERDSCDEGGCEVDSCASSSECLMSTRGERLVTKETKCKRC